MSIHRGAGRLPALRDVLATSALVSLGASGAAAQEAPAQRQPPVRPNATAFAQKYFQSVLTQCGTTYFVGQEHSGTGSLEVLYELDGPTVRAVQHRQGTMDARNGIRWKGTMHLGAVAHRTWTLVGGGTWDDWRDSDLLSAYIEHRGGRWLDYTDLNDGYLSTRTITKVSCDEVARARSNGRSPRTARLSPELAREQSDSLATLRALDESPPAAPAPTLVVEGTLEIRPRAGPFDRRGRARESRIYYPQALADRGVEGEVTVSIVVTGIRHVPGTFQIVSASDDAFAAAVREGMPYLSYLDYHPRAALGTPYLLRLKVTFRP